MKSFHFSLGDSTNGPVGFCAEVRAESLQDALKILRKALPEEVEVDTDDVGIEYVRVYLNADALRTKDCDEETDLDEESAAD